MGDILGEIVARLVGELIGLAIVAAVDANEEATRERLAREAELMNQLMGAGWQGLHCIKHSKSIIHN